VVSRPRPRPRATEIAGVALILLSAACFGSGALLANAAFDAGMAPLPVLFWRFLGAAVTAWLFTLVSPAGRASLAGLQPRRAGTLLFLGTVYVGNGWAFVASLALLPVSLVAMVVYLHPVFVAVGASLLGTGPRGSRAWVALGVAMAGLVLSVGGVPAGVEPDPLGLFLAILCPLIYSGWILLAARLTGDRRGSAPGEGATTTGASVATALMMSATAVAFGAIVLLSGGSIAPADVPADAWPALIGFGAASGIAVQSFYAGVRRIGGARAAIVSAVEQVYTIILAILLLGEAVTAVQVVGCALVIGGIVLAESAGAGGRARRAEASAAESG